jgi:hypothetical protein
VSTRSLRTAHHRKHGADGGHVRCRDRELRPGRSWRRSAPLDGPSTGLCNVGVLLRDPAAGAARMAHAQSVGREGSTSALAGRSLVARGHQRNLRPLLTARLKDARIARLGGLGGRQCNTIGARCHPSRARSGLVAAPALGQIPRNFARPAPIRTSAVRCADRKAKGLSCPPRSRHLELSP